MKRFFKELTHYPQKGVTLVELLLYMGILTVLLATLTSIYTSALDVQLESTASSSIGQDGNYILARLAYDVHRAEVIVAPASGGTADSFQITIDGVDYTYSIDGNDNLILNNDLGINNLNNYDTEISNFSITRLGNGMVEDTLRISFTVSSRTERISGPETEDFQTNLSLRRQ